jgi:hypothetical protein
MGNLAQWATDIPHIVPTSHQQPAKGKAGRVTSQSWRSTIDAGLVTNQLPDVRHGFPVVDRAVRLEARSRGRCRRDCGPVSAYGSVASQSSTTV